MIKPEDDKKLYNRSTNNNLPIFPSISGVWEFHFNYTGFSWYGYNFCPFYMYVSTWINENISSFNLKEFISNSDNRDRIIITAWNKLNGNVVTEKLDYPTGFCRLRKLSYYCFVFFLKELLVSLIIISFYGRIIVYNFLDQNVNNKNKWRKYQKI